MTHAIRLLRKDLSHRKALAASIPVWILLFDNAPFIGSPEMELLGVLKWIAVFAFAVLLIQDDPIAGRAGFWLTRPLSTQQWMVGKFLSVVLVVIVPAVAAEGWFLLRLDAPASLAALCLLRCFVYYMIVLWAGAFLGATTATFLGALVRGFLIFAGLLACVFGLMWLITDHFHSNASGFDQFLTPLTLSSDHFPSTVLGLLVLLSCLLLAFEFFRPSRLASGLLMAMSVPIPFCLMVLLAPPVPAYSPQAVDSLILNRPSDRIIAEAGLSIPFSNSVVAHFSGADDSQLVFCDAEYVQVHDARQGTRTGSNRPLLAICGEGYDGPFLHALFPGLAPKPWNWPPAAIPGRIVSTRFPIPQIVGYFRPEPVTVTLKLGFVHQTLSKHIVLPARTGAATGMDGERLSIDDVHEENGAEVVKIDMYGIPPGISGARDQFNYVPARFWLFDPANGNYCRQEKVEYALISLGTNHGSRITLHFGPIRNVANSETTRPIDANWRANAQFAELIPTSHSVGQITLDLEHDASAVSR